MESHEEIPWEGQRMGEWEAHTGKAACHSLGKSQLFLHSPLPLTSLFGGKLTRTNLQKYFSLIIFGNGYCSNTMDSSALQAAVGTAQEDREQCGTGHKHWYREKGGNNRPPCCPNVPVLSEPGCSRRAGVSPGMHKDRGKEAGQGRSALDCH